MCDMPHSGIVTFCIESPDFIATCLISAMGMESRSTSVPTASLFVCVCVCVVRIHTFMLIHSNAFDFSDRYVIGMQSKSTSDRYGIRSHYTFVCTCVSRYGIQEYFSSHYTFVCACVSLRGVLIHVKS